MDKGVSSIISSIGRSCSLLNSGRLSLLRSLRKRSRVMMTAAMMKAETRPARRGSRVGPSCTISSPTLSWALWLTASPCASKCVAVALSFTPGAWELFCVIVVVVVVVEAVVIAEEAVDVVVAEGVIVGRVSLVVGVILSICAGACDCDALVVPRWEGEVGGGTGGVSVLLVELEFVKMVGGWLWVTKVWISKAGSDVAFSGMVPFVSGKRAEEFVRVVFPLDVFSGSVSSSAVLLKALLGLVSLLLLDTLTWPLSSRLDSAADVAGAMVRPGPAGVSGAIELTEEVSFPCELEADSASSSSAKIFSPSLRSISFALCNEPKKDL